MDIETILNKINPLLAKNIKFCTSTIYRINKKHRFFLKLLQENPCLEKAEYIIYPNISGGENNKIFLSSNGLEILQYKNGVSEFILAPIK
ncbi:hypothetical protein [Aliarcobacter butzleri]|uniref:hypothetical protein n=1 Tax=Aliarcobacter butzleri TaxID=28197 RepID=UPI001269C635|nr:hypothetical protein [Aliarcobacter butzleri]